MCCPNIAQIVILNVDRTDIDENDINVDGLDDEASHEDSSQSHYLLRLIDCKL